MYAVLLTHSGNAYKCKGCDLSDPKDDNWGIVMTGVPTKAFPSDCWDKIFLTEIEGCSVQQGVAIQSSRTFRKTSATRGSGWSMMTACAGLTRNAAYSWPALQACSSIECQRAHAPRTRTLPIAMAGTPAFLYASSTICASEAATSMTRPSSSANKVAMAP